MDVGDDHIMCNISGSIASSILILSFSWIAKHLWEHTKKISKITTFIEFGYIIWLIYLGVYVNVNVCERFPCKTNLRLEWVQRI